MFNNLCIRSFAVDCQDKAFPEKMPAAANDLQ
jgi:hypothetical protein